MLLFKIFVGDPNNFVKVVYLLYNGNHYQCIITGDISYSDIDHHILHLDDTLTNAHSSNDNHCKMNISIAMDRSYQDDFAIDRIDESSSITEESTSSLYCQLCNNGSNSLTFLESISQESFNFTQEVPYENVPDEASVAHATIQDATNIPIINYSALARE
jgi:hypothetical protein